MPQATTLPRAPCVNDIVLNYLSTWIFTSSCLQGTLTAYHTSTVYHTCFKMNEQSCRSISDCIKGIISIALFNAISEVEHFGGGGGLYRVDRHHFML
jgi:hypothetical protein